MTKERVLISLADNEVVVVDFEYSNIAEKQRKILSLRSYYENKTYDEVRTIYNNFGASPQSYNTAERDCLEALDSDNTDFIHKEIQSYSYVKQPHKFKNELNDVNYPSGVLNLRNTFHFNEQILDSTIPEVIKNLGVEIVAKDEVFDVKYDRLRGVYHIENYNSTQASVTDRNIKFFRKHLTFPPAEYQKICQFSRDYEQAKRLNPSLLIFDYAEQKAIDNKELSLYNIYANRYMAIKAMDKSLLHEFTHIKNKMLIRCLGLKSDSKRLSVENTYRLQVEDERSAYLSQVISSVNKYLKSSNPDDYNFFDFAGSSLVNKLKTLSPSERFVYVSNPENLLKTSLDYYDRYQKDNYDKGQMHRNTPSYIDKLPLTYPEDSNGEYFNKLRSLMYRFKLYNPSTQREEEVNFARYIQASDEVKISYWVEANIITPNKRRLLNRMRDFNRDLSADKIDISLIDEAKKLMRDKSRTPRFVNSFAGFNVDKLLDEDNTPQNNIPNDKAGWSDNLKKYWEKVDGYQEIAKNNNEYRFKIKEDTLSYSAPNKVKVSDGAKYDVYVKLLQEPTNKSKPIRFKETLSEEQALKLYVACINNGRKPVGKIPTNLTAIENIQDIPFSEKQKFKNIMSNQSVQQNQSMPINAQRSRFGVER